MMSASYQAGALAFRSALIEIEKAHGVAVLNDKEGCVFGVRQVLPILRNAFDQYASGELAAGFWDAFAYWIAQPIDGCSLPSAIEWNVLRDLARDEDVERTYTEGLSPLNVQGSFVHSIEVES